MRLNLLIILCAASGVLIACNSNLQRYQTFDEYTMKGEHEVVDTPYVFVDETDTNIIIKRSDSDKNIIYQRMPTYFYNKQSFEMDKLTTHGANIDKNATFTPSIYHRYIYHDTIFEYAEFYSSISSVSERTIYVKTKHNCTYIAIKGNFINNPNKDSFKDVLKLYRDNLQQGNFSVYSKEQKYDSMFYISINNNYIKRYGYKLNALGEYCIPPGLGQFWKNNSIQKRNGQMFQDAYLEKFVDIKASPRINNSFLEKIVQKKIRKQFANKYNGRTTIIKLKIDKNGDILEVKVLRELGIEIDKAIIDAANLWPRFNPAIKEGVPVASWLLVSIKI